MIEIRKIREPHVLTVYRKTEGATYDGMHGAKAEKTDDDVYHVTLASLAREQGYICAYCMRKIPQKKADPPMTIEHIKPQSGATEEERLDYGNMLAVCNGNRNSKDNNSKTCDASRGSKPMVVNPLKARTLDTIRYKSDGTITSADERINENLNHTLNLNYAPLKECRRRVLEDFQKEIKRRFQDKSVTKQYLERKLEDILGQEKKMQFAGILVYWLKKRLKQFEVTEH